MLMSDHGARFDADSNHTRRSTTDGKYEERLPYLAIRLPPGYALRHPEKLANLRRNAAEDRLTTAFDLHETLLEFAALRSSKTTKRTPEVEKVRGPRRGISLLDEIPASRTCEDADVAPHWCTCLQWRRTSVDDSNVRQGAIAVIDTINRMTSSHPNDCFRLTLDVIRSADLYAADERLLLFRRSADMDGRVPEMVTPLRGEESGGAEVLYRLTLTTSPGGGLYEATVRLVLENHRFIVDTRQISRINAYGNQPHCVASTEPHLRPYCLCVQPFNTTTTFSRND